MRLLEGQSNGEFRLTDDLIENIPAYAILSHTWGNNDEEVTFRDLLDGSGKDKRGYAKIKFCGDQAARDGLRYFWVDTCNIDKTNNVELTEAINSMYRWYRDAARCYVYLSDVTVNEPAHPGVSAEQTWRAAFESSKWFTRGWTLQELLAPQLVEFFSADYQRLGCRNSLQKEIHEITKIPLVALQGKPLSTFAVAERLSWAEHRKTKRQEDMAYCLLGIAEVYMPLIYGEGRENAIARLHDEVDRRSRGNIPRSFSADAYHSTRLSTRHTSTTQTDTLSLDTAFGKRKRAFEQDDLIRSLAFQQMDARHLNVRKAHSKTCKWLVDHPTYIQWCERRNLHQHHGFLWIKGKPGSGKSTIMKEAITQVRGKLRHEPKMIILHFFFNARASDSLEKSKLGMYRSLSHQLLKAFPSLHAYFAHNFESKTMQDVDDVRWTDSELQNFLLEAVEQLEDRSIYIFIDAIDECEEEDVRDMVNFLQQLGGTAVSLGKDLNICLSSRHYPHISIGSALSLILEEQSGHEQDIADYIESTLPADVYPEIAAIQETVRTKANGIFLWVVLVLRILKEVYDSGEINEISRRLEEIPENLNALFAEILSRNPKEKEKAILLLQWVLFARRPLTPSELYWAIKSHFSPTENSSLAPEKEEQIRKFLLHCSKGLTETSRSSPPRVQFIHETVRTYFLQNHGLAAMLDVSDNNYVGPSHDRLKKSCLRYIGFTKATRKGTHLNKVKKLFLEYCVAYIFHHADIAAQEGISQTEFLQNIKDVESPTDSPSTTPWSEWILLHNSFEKFPIRRYTSTATMLYVFSEKGFAGLVHHLIPISADINFAGERYGNPLQAACISGSAEIARKLIDARADVNAEGGEHQHALFAALVKKGYSTFALLRHRGAVFPPDSSMFFKCGVTLVHRDDLTGLRLLLGAFARPASWDMSMLLHKAVVRGNLEAVKLLLTMGAEAHTQTHFTRTPLQVASAQGHELIVKLLLDSGADVTAKMDARAGIGSHALGAASSKGHERIAKLLLESGAKVDMQAGLSGTALQAASLGGHEKVVRLLLAHGADVNLVGGYHGTALHAASDSGHDLIVRLLLDNGADINARVENITAVVKACTRGKEQVAKLLLERGANFDADDADYALKVATSLGHERVLKLLFDEDVRFSTKHGYEAAISDAARTGYRHILKLLREEGGYAAG